MVKWFAYIERILIPLLPFSSGQGCRWDRWCESEADRSEDEREHPDDNQGLVPLTSHLQGRRHPLLQGGHLTGLWSNHYLWKLLTFFYQERSKNESGAGAKAGEKRKPITFYSANEKGSSVKQGKPGRPEQLCQLLIPSTLISWRLARQVWRNENGRRSGWQQEKVSLKILTPDSY